MEPIARNFEAYLDELTVITVLLPKSYYGGESQTFSLCKKELDMELDIIKKQDIETHIKYICTFTAVLSIGDEYIVKDERGHQTDLQVGAVIRTNDFDELYSYDGDDLGVLYSLSESTFKVWAPSSTSVKLKIFNETQEQVEIYQMMREQNGVWELTIPGDLEGLFYTYLVCVNQSWREAVDPYAKAVSINGEYGVIINLEKTKVDPITLSPFQKATDAIIYETHVRDFSIDSESGINQKGKYLGITEMNTKGPQGTISGLSYLLDLGITHVELLPVNDFYGVKEDCVTEEYNWGYNPLHFNVPEGSYCSNPRDPYNRICELKNVIETFHQHGLRVIIDVVYNHVYIREESSYEKIVPGYYFRHDKYGMPSNGTGVGNDIASERKMARKFIVDSVSYWLKEFNVDGFRFDLMGILDVETMNSIRRTVDEINPDVLILGEGWDLNTPLSIDQKASIRNAQKMPRIAYFNDRFRDGIKGSTFNLYDRGFALGNNHKLIEAKESIAGSVSFMKGHKGLFLEPTQTINYVESHDNHTLWDKLIVCNSHESEEILKKRHLLATAMVLLSQGIPFLHSGQEFFRTKQGVENSYKSPDSINKLDWARKQKYVEEVEYIKGLISIRKVHGAFRFDSTAQIRSHLKFYDVPEGVLMYSLFNVEKYGPWSSVLVIHSNSCHSKEVELPSHGKWFVVCKEQKAGIEPLSTLNESRVIIDPISTMVLFRK
ncbi:type I pullulanase [Cytobacillus suaedae]|nr:type I pullulanase [Cytobacillus suaedae]